MRRMGSSRPSPPSAPLHLRRVEQPLATVNRLQILLHLLATLAILSYRAANLLALLRRRPSSSSSSSTTTTTLSWALLSFAELLLAFIWVLNQAARLRPVSRAVFPDRLPDDGSLPAVDVFVMTADPDKEPTVAVMNTVVSAMALDYPADKLHVYISDDAGSPVTLRAANAAYSFARAWVPFCKRNKIAGTCPEAYFCGPESEIDGGAELTEERAMMKCMYGSFMERVKKIKETTPGTAKGRDHLPHIEIIKDEEIRTTISDIQHQIPSLIYVSREKKKNSPHHFKAGALNVLLRVSGMISNSPYILSLDCDMYSNDPSSARQAMCFHLDPHLSPTLAFVQFPQEFPNLSKNDIYAAELRNFFKIVCKGCDGLRGPMLCGTGFYIRRDALYGAKPGHKSTEEDFISTEFSELKQRFGASNEFILSLRQGARDRKNGVNDRITAHTVPQEAMLVASCAYEHDTKWGKEVGFLYGTVVEDYYTGLHLHCRGWVSTYCTPSRPAFLGSVPTNLNDALVQNKRWMTGLLEVLFSRHCPLTFGISSRNSILESMCYAWVAFTPLYAIPLLCYGTIPQLCFLSGISLFPKVSSPWFLIFGAVYLSSSSQHLMEVILCGRSIKTWWNEQRFWMLSAVTGQLFAILDFLLKLAGLRAVDFEVTSKAINEARIKRYEKGQFDFEGCSVLLMPAATLSVLNAAALVGGGWRMIKDRSFHEMFMQLFLSCLVLAISWPLLDGMLIRRDRGRVPAHVTWWSVALANAMLLLFFGFTA